MSSARRRVSASALRVASARPADGSEKLNSGPSMLSAPALRLDGVEQRPERRDLRHARGDRVAREEERLAIQLRARKSSIPDVVISVRGTPRFVSAAMIAAVRLLARERAVVRECRARAPLGLEGRGVGHDERHARALDRERAGVLRVRRSGRRARKGDGRKQAPRLVNEWS